MASPGIPGGDPATREVDSANRFYQPVRFAEKKYDRISQQGENIHHDKEQLQFQCLLPR
jgi:hypothetical protein